MRFIPGPRSRLSAALYPKGARKLSVPVDPESLTYFLKALASLREEWDKVQSELEDQGIRLRALDAEMQLIQSIINGLVIELAEVEDASGRAGPGPIRDPDACDGRD